jgi:hypothetical protein
MNLSLLAVASVAGLGAYQLDQIARVILVEVGPGPADGGVTLDSEAAGVARVVLNRARAWGMLPSSVLRVERGGGHPVWTLRLPKYLAAMERRGPGAKGYPWALARAAGAAAGLEGLEVGRRANFVHLGNAWFQDHPPPDWSKINPLVIGRTTFSGAV